MKTTPKRRKKVETPSSPLTTRGRKTSVLIVKSAAVKRDYSRKGPVVSWSSKDDAFEALLSTPGKQPWDKNEKSSDCEFYSSPDSSANLEENDIFSNPLVDYLGDNRKVRVVKRQQRKSVVTLSSTVRQYSQRGQKANKKPEVEKIIEEEEEEPEESVRVPLGAKETNLEKENDSLANDSCVDLFPSPEVKSFVNVSNRRPAKNSSSSDKENLLTTPPDSPSYSSPLICLRRQRNRCVNVQSPIESESLDHSVLAELADSPQFVLSPKDLYLRQVVGDAVTSTPEKVTASSPLFCRRSSNSIACRRYGVRASADRIVTTARTSVTVSKSNLKGNQRKTEPAYLRSKNTSKKSVVVKFDKSTDSESELLVLAPERCPRNSSIRPDQSLTDHSVNISDSVSRLEDSLKSLALDGRSNARQGDVTQRSSIRRSSGLPSELSKVRESFMINDSLRAVSRLSHSVRHSESRRSTVAINLSRPRLSSLSIPDNVALARKLASETVSDKDKVLALCKQKKIENFDTFANKFLIGCKKLGEGVYGEVYLARDRVYKVIPIEGGFEVNGDMQKTFNGILSEIIISRGLQALSDPANKMNRTDCFCALLDCTVVCGAYPTILVDAWELFDKEKQSENEHPSLFGTDQLYVVMEFRNGGKPLDSIGFRTSEAADSVFTQVAMSLAIAEKLLEFEHRDLHLGNILIERTEQSHVEFIVDGEELEVPSEGIKVNIIDFTLSRGVAYGVTAFCNLSEDEGLFNQDSDDFQFRVYDLMRESNKNDWKLFNPKSNVFWLKYLLQKLAKKVESIHPDFYTYVGFSETITSASEYIASQLPD